MEKRFGRGGGLTRTAFWLGGGLILAFAAVFWLPGQGGESGAVHQSENNEEWSKTEADRAGWSGIQGNAMADPGLDSGRLLMDCLYEAMEDGDLASAAACLEQNREVTRQLFGQASQEVRYLFDGTRFHKEIEGRGVVLQSPATVFYGTFRDGKPEGNVTAMRSIVLETPRYDYSIGKWSGGKMNGFGVTGYTYYGKLGKTDMLKAEKAGRFTDDRMEGSIRYISIDKSGDSSTWTVEVKSGVTVLDKRWVYQKSEDQYYLPAENDKNHGYLLDKQDRERVLWQNRIIWQE